MKINWTINTLKRTSQACEFQVKATCLSMISEKEEETHRKKEIPGGKNRDNQQNNCVGQTQK